jgi:hypothetical protein
VENPDWEEPGKFWQRLQPWRQWLRSCLES